MNDAAQRLISGEVNGRQYFNALLEEGIAQGVYIRDELGGITRAHDAPALGHLAIAGEPAPLTQDEVAANYARSEAFLKRPVIHFPEG